MHTRLQTWLIPLVILMYASPDNYAQNAWYPQGQERTNRLPLEQIVLHTDRELYVAGENIWFNAYYWIINQDTDIQLSHVLYIELFNSRTETIIREKFSIREGKASGCLKIPAEAATDAYLLRAYTQFQQNFPPESYTSVYLMVVNPEIPYQSEGSTGNDAVVIVPQGGNFVEGFASRAAVRITSSLAGKVKTIHVLDQLHRVIAPVRIYPNGLGTFELQPADSLDYYIFLELTDGDSISEPLPVIEHSGFIPSLEKTPRGLMYHLEGLLPPPASPGADLTLCVKSAEMITLQEIPVNRSEMAQDILVPDQYVYPGINYMVLKESPDIIHHVLPVFIGGQSTRELIIQTGKSQYQQRDEVGLNILPVSEPEAPIHVSVAVVKHGTQSEMDTCLPDYVIDHPFLLDSYIPAQGMPDPMIAEQIDLCMILYTPRLNTTLFQSELKEYESAGISFLPEIRDVSLSGQVIGRNSGKPVMDVPVILSVLDHTQLHLVKSREQGQFVFSLNNLNGLQSLFLCPKSGNDKDYELLIRHDFANQYPDPLELIPTIDSSWQPLVEEIWINAQLENFEPLSDPALTQQFKEEVLFAEHRMNVVLSDYIELASLYEVFWEIVPFVQVRKKKDHSTLQVINDRMEVYEDPLILLDNVPVYNVDELLKIPPGLVDRIEVINEPYLHGDIVLNGVVMVYTKTDNFAGSPFPKGSVFLDYQTIAPPSMFPVNDYHSTDKKESRLPDFRNLLFWDPDVILSGRSANVSFFTSDHIGTYDIIVRGFTADGQPCYGTKTIEVLP